MLGMVYSVIGILAIIIHCIVNGDTLFIRKNKNVSETTLCYHKFLWCILLFFISDALWGIFDGLGLIIALRVDTFIYYVAMSLAVVMWTEYVVVYLNQNNIFGKAVKCIGRIFLLFEILALIVNIFYPFFFWFDEEGTYYAGPVRYVALYIQIVLFLVSLFQTLFVIANSKGVKRRRHLAICLFAISISIAIYAQIAYPFLPIYSIGYLIGVCFLRVFVREDEKDEYYKNIKKELDIVSSLAGMYFCSYYVDMESRRFIMISNQIKENDVFIGTEGSATETIDKMINQLILPEYRHEARIFTDLDTLDERLNEKHYVSMQFESIHIGWAEGVFVAADRNDDGSLNHVIWAIRTINDEKAKEEKLIINSYMDELTGLYNRKMYAEDVDGEENGLTVGAKSVDINGEDFVFISLDVNGLKLINDTKGHAAGDELLKAAAICMKQCLGPYGRVYRTGGDEFIALLNISSEKLHEVLQHFEETTLAYKGKYVDGVSVSCGYVIKNEHPNLSILEIEILADQNMYTAKKLHYSINGIDRRVQQQHAYKALCMLYTKILMIDITNNTYNIISMDESEQVKDKGFSDGIFEWLENFAKSGQVHPDDQESYLAKTNRAFLNDYFEHNKTSLSFTYRRKTGDDYKLAEMEIIPTESYSDDSKQLFLYVKDIDK